MFTILHKSRTGHESYRYAPDVWFDPHRDDDQPPTLYASIPPSQIPDPVYGDNPVTYISGTVFVMNESGKTVGKYDFVDPDFELQPPPGDESYKNLPGGNPKPAPEMSSRVRISTSV
jgi:hypothetical protein